MKSRLQSHRNEASPSLFHTSYGVANPVTLQLSLTKVVSKDELSIRAAMSALLHERHHWLQTIGTLGGIFHYLLLDQQALIVQSLLSHEKSLGIDDLPLADGRFADSADILQWEHVEYIRRVFWGARRGDIRVFENDRYGLDFPAVTQLLRRMLFIAVEGSEDARQALSNWNVAGSRISRRPTLLDSSGWALGARHLMEDSARVTEIFRLARYGQDVRLLDEIDDAPTSNKFTGIYGKARSLFYSTVRNVSPGIDTKTPVSEMVFNYICDAALNRIYPPAGPAQGEFIDDVWNPATYMVFLCRGLSGFDLRRKVDVYDASQVRRLIFELDHHLDDALGGLIGSSRALTRATTKKIFSGIEAESVADELFRVDETGWPRAKSWHGRLSYVLALSKAALSLRETHPELFIFPACHYVSDRAYFHELFDPVAPPLVLYGDSGIAPGPDKQTGWMEYFLCDAIMYELLRGMVMSDPNDLQRKIAPYAKICFGVEAGRSLVEAVVRLFFGDRPVCDDFLRGLQMAWSNEP
jgi:hypothetical protein